MLKTPLFSLIGHASAQKEGRSLPVQILLLDESISLPGFSFLDYPYQPAFQLGTELSLKEGMKHDWHVAGNIGFYFHDDLRTAGFLNAQLGYRRTFGRFNASLAVGPGLAFAFAPQPVYVFENGTYQEGKNNGDLIFMPSGALNLAYRLRQAEKSPEVVFHYSLSLDAPFSVLPLPHLFVGLGLRFYPFK